MIGTFGVLGITGPRACSKSLIAELICALGTPGKFIWDDTSKIITRNMALGTAIGLELTKHKQDMLGGKVLPGELAYRAVIEWIEEQRKQKQVYFAILAGCTRSPEESACWKQSAYTFRTMHINATPDQVKRGTILRQELNGVVRTDENEGALNDAMDEHRKKILPGVKMLGIHAGYTSRSKTVRQRLIDTINHMPIPNNIRKQMFARLDTKNHLVSIRVDQLDGKKPMPTRSIVAEMPTTQQQSMIKPWVFQDPRFPHLVGLTGPTRF